MVGSESRALSFAEGGLNGCGYTELLKTKSTNFINNLKKLLIMPRSHSLAIAVTFLSRTIAKGYRLSDTSSGSH